MHSHPASNPSTPNARLAGIIWMLGSVFCFAVFDALTKHLAQHLQIVVLIWARYLIHTLLAIFLFLPRHGLGVFKTSRLGAQTVRGMLMLGVSLCMMNAAKYLPLSELTALYFTAPLMVLMFSPFFLGEKLHKRDVWVAIVGFIGVVLIAKPQPGFGSPVSLLPLIAAALYAAFQLFTRNFSKTENPIATNVMTGIVGTAAMSAVLPLTMQERPLEMSAASLIALLALGFSGFFAQWMLIKAFAADAPAKLAPFSYTQLIWATLIGYLIFGNTPDLKAAFGMGLIAASGLTLLIRK